MENRVVIYEDKQGDTELEILISYDEMRKAVEATSWYAENYSEPGMFKPVCDWCGEGCETYHFFPELGHKVSCDKCAKEHKKIVQWYVIDTHTVFNMLITWVKTYDIGWSKKDFDKIDEFFGTKGHQALHIEKFMED